MTFWAAATSPGMLWYGAGLLAFLMAAIQVVAAADRSVMWIPQPKCRDLQFRRPDFTDEIADHALATIALCASGLFIWAMGLGLVADPVTFFADIKMARVSL